MVWLPDGKKNFEDTFICFDMIHKRDRQTDRHCRQTDTQTPHDGIASRGKNPEALIKSDNRTCHRTLFLPRDAMQFPSVCLSLCVCVCLSRSYILSKRINISSKFSPSSSHTILVLLYQTTWQYSVGNLTGASNAGRVGRNRDSGFTACCEPFQWQVQYCTLSCDGPWRVYNTSRW